MKNWARTENFRVYKQINEFYLDPNVFISSKLGFDSNDFIRISYGKGKAKKTIYVCIRIIDSYYKKFYESILRGRYRKNVITLVEKPYPIIMNKYYRNRLGIKDEDCKNVELEIRKVKSLLNKIRSYTNAPDSLTKLMTWLGIISVIMGAVGVFLGLLGVLMGVLSIMK